MNLIMLLGVRGHDIIITLFFVQVVLGYYSVVVDIHDITYYIDSLNY